jgi:hypothetical protein
MESHEKWQRLSQFLDQALDLEGFLSGSAIELPGGESTLVGRSGGLTSP